MNSTLRASLTPEARRRLRRLADAYLSARFGSWNSSDSVASVALTLDDGPDDINTPAILERLADANVRATFFLLALRAERFRSESRAIAAAGHEIALHGLDHRRVNRMHSREAYSYLSEARDRLEQVVGRSIELFRPPYGSQSVTSFRAARRAGLRVVVWNGDAADWVDRPLTDVVEAASSACQPGGILLLHERLEPDPEHQDPILGAPQTTFDRALLVADLVQLLRRRGLEPCSVDDLARSATMRSTAWFRR